MERERKQLVLRKTVQQHNVVCAKKTISMIYCHHKPLKINHITLVSVAAFVFQSSVQKLLFLQHNSQKAVTVLLKVMMVYITSILYSKFRLSAVLSVFPGCIIYSH